MGFLKAFVSPGRCEPKGVLTGSNAGITSIEFDTAVSYSVYITSLNKGTVFFY